MPNDGASGSLLHDPRALLGDRASPRDPGYGPDVSASLAASGHPGLRLALIGHKKVSTYEAWLWGDQAQRAYYSKKMANGRSFAWATGTSIERVRAHIRRGTMEFTDGEKNV
jgi:hypothetical protein